jgi:hypothetical protein
MRPILSAVVTLPDLKDYFKGGHWKKISDVDGGIEGKSEAYKISIVQKSATFEVEIHASDDPSDSETKKTKDPVEFITGFLSTGPGSEDILKKMSFYADPRFMVTLLRRMANLAESGMKPGEVAKSVRRGAALMDGHRFRPMLSAVVRSARGDDAHASDEVAKLQKEMKAKGWKVTQDEDDKGRMKLVVDVSGIYEASIVLDSITWDYSFEVNEIPDSKEAGETEDPIQQFRLYYKSDSTQEARKQLKEKIKQKSEEETVAPAGKGRKKEEETDVDAPKSKDVPGAHEDTVFAPTQLPPSLSPKNLEKNKYSD